METSSLSPLRESRVFQQTNQKVLPGYVSFFDQEADLENDFTVSSLAKKVIKIQEKVDILLNWADDLTQTETTPLPISLSPVFTKKKYLLPEEIIQNLEKLLLLQKLDTTLSSYYPGEIKVNDVEFSFLLLWTDHLEKRLIVFRKASLLTPFTNLTKEDTLKHVNLLDSLKKKITRHHFNSWKPSLILNHFCTKDTPFFTLLEEMPLSSEMDPFYFLKEKLSSFTDLPPLSRGIVSNGEGKIFFFLLLKKEKEFFFTLEEKNKNSCFSLLYEENSPLKDSIEHIWKEKQKAIWKEKAILLPKIFKNFSIKDPMYFTFQEMKILFPFFTATENEIDMVQLYQKMEEKNLFKLESKIIKIGVFFTDSKKETGKTFFLAILRADQGSIKIFIENPHYSSHILEENITEEDFFLRKQLLPILEKISSENKKKIWQENKLEKLKKISEKQGKKIDSLPFIDLQKNLEFSGLPKNSSLTEILDFLLNSSFVQKTQENLWRAILHFRKDFQIFLLVIKVENQVTLFSEAIEAKEWSFATTTADKKSKLLLLKSFLQKKIDESWAKSTLLTNYLKITGLNKCKKEYFVPSKISLKHISSLPDLNASLFSLKQEILSNQKLFEENKIYQGVIPCSLNIDYTRAEVYLPFFALIIEGKIAVCLQIDLYEKPSLFSYLDTELSFQGKNLQEILIKQVYQKEWEIKWLETKKLQEICLCLSLEKIPFVDIQEIKNHLFNTLSQKETEVFSLAETLIQVFQKQYLTLPYARGYVEVSKHFCLYFLLFRSENDFGKIGLLLEIQGKNQTSFYTYYLDECIYQNTPIQTTINTYFVSEKKNEWKVLVGETGSFFLSVFNKTFDEIPYIFMEDIIPNSLEYDEIPLFFQDIFRIHSIDSQEVLKKINEDPRGNSFSREQKETLLKEVLDVLEKDEFKEEKSLFQQDNLVSLFFQIVLHQERKSFTSDNSSFIQNALENIKRNQKIDRKKIESLFEVVKKGGIAISLIPIQQENIPLLWIASKDSAIAFVIEKKSVSKSMLQSKNVRWPSPKKPLRYSFLQPGLPNASFFEWKKPGWWQSAKTNQKLKTLIEPFPESFSFSEQLIYITSEIDSKQFLENWQHLEKTLFHYFSSIEDPKDLFFDLIKNALPFLDKNSQIFRGLMVNQKNGRIFFSLISFPIQENVQTRKWCFFFEPFSSIEEQKTKLIGYELIVSDPFNLIETKPFAEMIREDEILNFRSKLFHLVPNSM